MKKLILILFILSFAAPSLAVTVGGPDFTIPEESLYKRDEAVNKALDRYSTYDLNLKHSVELEFITKKKLSASSEVLESKVEGQYYMLKVAKNFNNIVEPYIKIGTSNLEVKWQTAGTNIVVEAKPGFVWGLGVKAKVWEFKDYGVKLTLDFQYRNADLDIDSTTITPPLSDKQFEITDWQTSLLASKKVILPVGLRDYYLIPYAGLTFSSTDVDVSFAKNTGLYSTYNASDKHVFGLVFGCDVMPSLLSWYLINFELRLINETALTLGGTIKF